MTTSSEMGGGANSWSLRVLRLLRVSLRRDRLLQPCFYLWL